MTFHRLGQMNRNQRGFTLVEVLISLAITGIISAGIVTTISQVVNVNVRSTAHMTAVKEVENAIHWITRDAQMAQSVNATAPSGFPLTLTWVEWDNTSSNVTYSFVGDPLQPQLQRSYSLNGGQPTNTTVIQHVNSGSQMTNCQFSGGVLTFKITATIGDFTSGSETRSFEVIPRCAS